MKPKYEKKGTKQKKKTKAQIKALKQFFNKSKNGDWKKHEVQELASQIDLSFKEVNKWLWD